VHQQSITQGHVQAAPIDTTAATLHAYLSVDMGEGVRVGADAVLASETLAEDPSLDQSSTVRRSSRAHAGQQASTADTYQAAAGVIFSKKDFGAQTLTQALHELLFGAAKALQIMFWNKAFCACTVYSKEGYCSGSPEQVWFL
jgi:hypothetical protein